MYLPKSRFTKTLKGITILLLIASVASCSALGVGGEEKDQKIYIAAVEAFNTSFRWQDFKAAAEWLPPSQQAQFWDLADVFAKRVRIHEFTIRSLTSDKHGATGAAVIQLQIYYTDCPNLESKNIRQTWQYHEKEKRWYIVETGYAALLPLK